MIDSERFDAATAVVEQGAKAAEYMLRLPQDERPQAREAHAMLTDDVRGEPMSQDALLDLLGVALMIIGYERVSGQRYTDA